MDITTRSQLSTSTVAPLLSSVISPSAPHSADFSSMQSSHFPQLRHHHQPSPLQAPVLISPLLVLLRPISPFALLIRLHYLLYSCQCLSFMLSPLFPQPHRVFQFPSLAYRFPPPPSTFLPHHNSWHSLISPVPPCSSVFPHPSTFIHQHFPWQSLISTVPPCKSIFAQPSTFLLNTTHETLKFLLFHPEAPFSRIPTTLFSPRRVDG